MTRPIQAGGTDFGRRPCPDHGDSHLLPQSGSARRWQIRSRRSTNITLRTLALRKSRSTTFELRSTVLEQSINLQLASLPVTTVVSACKNFLAGK